MARLFLLHAREDEARARALAAALSAAEHATWSHDDILVGESILQAETQALLAADFVVLCVSRTAVESGWVRAALSRAIMQQLEQRSTRILPVRLESAESPALLEDVSHVDIFPEGEGFRRGVRRLLRSIAEHQKRASSKPRSSIGGSSKGASPPWVSPAVPNNLPRRRTFVGREKELQMLEELLEGSPEQAAEAPDENDRVALYGLGGSGKTALALEYAHRALQRGRFPGGVFWLLAEGKPLDRLLQLADDLRVVGAAPVRSALALRRAPADRLVRTLRLALQNQAEPTLLVLDNVDEAGFAGELPGGAVRILMTTRDERLAFWRRIRVDALPAPAAVKLARKLAGEPRGEGEAEALASVVNQELGGLPVAVQMAALAVLRWARSWTSYSQHLREQRQSATLSPLLEAPEPHSDYGRSVVGAIDLSIDRCLEGSTERLLLAATAVLDAESIPIEWVAEAADRDPDEVDFQRALSVLTGLGLVTASDDGRHVSMHRLVYLRERQRAAPSQWIEVSRRCAAAVAGWLIESVDLGRAEEVEARRSHIEEALRASERAGSDIHGIEIMDRLGMHLAHHARFEEALPLLCRALAKAEQLRPPSPGQVATSLVNLAIVLKDLGRPLEARPLLERSIKMTEDHYGERSRKLVVRLSNLAMVLQDVDRTLDAWELLTRALFIAEREYGSEHSKVAIILSNLALVLKEVGHSALARPLLERALAILERALGERHDEVATALSNLALVLLDQGHAVEARPLLERALAIDEEIFGREHPRVAVAVYNLIDVLLELGLVKEADDLRGRERVSFEHGQRPTRAHAPTTRAKMYAARGDRGAARDIKGLIPYARLLSKVSQGAELLEVSSFFRDIMWSAVDRTVIRGDSDDAGAPTPIGVRCDFDDADAPIPVGGRVGEYVVKDTLAAGGFGIVYRVEHAVTGAPAALKVLHAELASTHEAVLRFEREVDLIRQLHHPNVVEIYESGRLADGRPYFVMELLDGVDLEAHVRSRRLLPPSEVLAILEPLCAALSAAHEQGIVHRDIKASNVFSATKGGERRVVLLDFGVAKLIDEQGPGLTAPSHVVGTPSCMAPEQITGQPTDARTDVYALGALTYYMLTGELPFHDASVLMVQYMHLNSTPLKPSAIAPVGPAFDHVVLRAMSKHPSARFASAGDLLADFRLAVEGGDEVPAESHERRMVAIHIEVQAEPSALEEDDLDDDLYRDMEAALPFASRILLQKGYMLAAATGNTRVLVKELPKEPDKEPIARRDAVRTALALERQLASRPTYDDRVRVSMCLHVGQVQVAGGKLVDGELLGYSSWVKSATQAGVIVSPQVLLDLGLNAQPLDNCPDAGGYLRVIDAPGKIPEKKEPV